MNDKELKRKEFLWGLRKSSTIPCLKQNIPHLIQKMSIHGTALSSSEKAYIGSCFLPNTMKWFINFGHKAFCGFFDPSGQRFISAGQDKIIKIFDASDFTLQREILGRDVGWSILDIALSPDSTKLVYSSWSKKLHLVDLDLSSSSSNSHKGLKITDNSSCGVFSLQFAGDGQRVFCALTNGDLCIYDLEHQKVINTVFESHSDKDINSVSIMDKSGNVFITGADDCLIKVWDSRDLSSGPIGTFAGHQDGIVFIDSKGDFRYFISNSKDQTIKLWDFRRFSNPSEDYWPKKRIDWDYRWGSVPLNYSKLTPLANDASVLTLKGHSVIYTLIRARFSPAESTGQRYVYSGSGSGQWFMWDLLSGESTPCAASRPDVLDSPEVFQGHRGAVRDVSWHPWQPTLVTSSFDKRMALWTSEKMVGSTAPSSTKRRTSMDASRIWSLVDTESDDESNESADDEEDSDSSRGSPYQFQKVYCRPPRSNH